MPAQGACKYGRGGVASVAPLLRSVTMPREDLGPDIRDLARRIEVLEAKDRAREGAEAAKRRLEVLGLVFSKGQG